MTDTNTSSTPNPEPPPQSCNAACGCGCNVVEKLKASALKALEFCKAPADSWRWAKSESLSITDIYCKYLVPAVLLGIAAGFIGHWLVGFPVPFIGRVRLGFFGSIWTALISLFTSLVAPYIAAKVFSVLAPKFNVTLSETDAFKLIAFSCLPATFAQVANIIPGFLPSLLLLATGVYGIYLFLQGVDVITEVQADKKWPFIAAGVVCTFLVNIVLALLLGVITPRPQAEIYYPEKMNVPGLGNIKPEDLNNGIKFLEQMQKNMGK